MARSKAETHVMAEHAPCGDVQRGGEQMMRDPTTLSLKTIMFKRVVTDETWR